MNNIDLLNKFSENKQSKWLEHAKWREENAAWLDKSAKIAFKVLSTLKKKSMSKRNFAALMGVSPQYISKLLQGSENMSLETISKMEDILHITLIEISEEYQTTISFPTGKTDFEYKAPFKFVVKSIDSDVSSRYTDNHTNNTELSA